MQATFVEQLRVKCADERMQSPSLREEETAIRWNGSMRTQNVIERRDGDPVGMATLYRLFELPRIPQQHNTLCGLGDSQHVGERHLRGFVDEEYVDAARGVGSCPEPGRSAPHPTVRKQGVQKSRIVGRKPQAGKIVFLVGELLDASDRNVLFARSHYHLIKKIADDLVTVSR